MFHVGNKVSNKCVNYNTLKALSKKKLKMKTIRKKLLKMKKYKKEIKIKKLLFGICTSSLIIRKHIL